MHGSGRSLQRRFPVAFQTYSRSSRDVVRNLTEILMFWTPNFLEMDPQIVDVRL